MTQTGLDRLSGHWPRQLDGKRVGLLCHPASLNRALQHASEILLRHADIRLTCLFGPQHGIRGDTQANMIEWEGYTDPRTGLKAYSLYGEHRKPTPEMLKNIEVLVVDLFDVGARYYTYIWTLLLCMEACAENGKSLVVLDRPNPLGGLDVEGPVLDPDYSSFVGLKPMAIRHGMTMGEMACYMKGEWVPDCDLHVIGMTGWKRTMFFDETGLPWALPSPNMPTLDTALVYPGMCLLEGTNLSEGRGTTRPFEIFGAPFIDADALCRSLNGLKLQGVTFRPLSFTPTFDKYAGTLCHGAHIHVTDRKRFRSFHMTASLLHTVRALYGSRLKWLKGPYEYEHRKLPIDILFGTDLFRKAIDENQGISVLRKLAQADLKAFEKRRRRYLLY